MNSLNNFIFRYAIFTLCLCSPIFSAPRSPFEILFADWGKWATEEDSPIPWAIQFDSETKNAAWQLKDETAFELKARYEISDSNVIIETHIDQAAEYERKYDKQINPKGRHRTICQIREDKKSLLYKYVLLCDNGFRLYNNAYFRVDEEAMIGKVPVVIIGRRSAKTVKPLKFRLLPATSAKFFTCTVEGETRGRPKTIGHIPEGRHIFLIARTRNKERVENWLNYWYYISVYNDHYLDQSCATKYGWVYGEFIAID